MYHDRGPGEEATGQSATDEDSQESMTLKNALPPLPDTQPSQLGDPERVQQAPALHDERPRLISRPQDADIDPAASFSYGPPTKVTPGQFSRIVPPKPRNFVHEALLNNNAPNVEYKSVTEQPKTAPNDKAPATLKPTPHVKHCQPQFPPPDPRDQRAIQRTSPAHQALIPREREPHGEHVDGDGNSEAQSSHQYSDTDYQDNIDSTSVKQKPYRPSQHYQQPTMKTNAVATQAPGKNHRVSLPNDTSVSSPSASKDSPHQGLSRTVTQANRSIRDLRQVSNVRTPSNRPTSRSSVHNSNISKKRSVQHRPARGTTRASRIHSRCIDDGEESPSARRRAGPSPVESSGSLYSGHRRHPGVLSDLMPDAQVVVQAMNSLFKTLEVTRERAEVEISRLERLTQKQQKKLSRCEKGNENATNVIIELQKSQGDLQEKLAIANQELSNRSEKSSKLEEKCRQYKEYLNKAIAEQQNLYRAASVKCEDAIKQIREAETKQQALNVQERRQADATRERLNQVVKSTIAECKSKECEFADKIDALNQRIQQQEVHISQERETTRKLLQNDKALTSVQETVKSIGSQVEQIAANLANMTSRQHQQDNRTAEEMQSQLKKMLERLSTLEEHVPSTDIVQAIQETNAETFNTILEHVSGSEARAQADIQKLADGIEDYMEDFWMKLEDREDVLTELLEQVQAENEQLSTQLQLKRDECSDLFARHSDIEATVIEREKQIGELKEEIAVVEQAQATGIEEIARANMLSDEYNKVKGDLQAKVILASELQNRLQQSESALTAQSQEHERSTERLNKLLEQREKEARESQKAAVELARQEVLLDMSKAKETMQTLLDQAQEERATLQNDLDTARQKISSMEAEDERSSARVSELNIELQTAQSKANSLGVEVSHNKSEHQKLQEQQSLWIRDLEVKIAEKETAIGHLSENAQTYDKQAQKVLDVLKRWAEENKSVKHFVTGLQEVEQRDLDGIEPEIKSLFEIDMFHRAIFQYVQAQKGAPLSSPNSQRSVGQCTEERQGASADNRADGTQKSTAFSRIVEQIRRVTVRSPSGTVPSPRPPSVQTEQARRRSADPPKSIMKEPSQHSLVEEGGEVEQDVPSQEETTGPSAFAGRTYGRYVSAKKRREEEEQQIRDQGLPSRGDFGRRTYRQAVASKKSHQDERVVSEGPADAGSIIKHGLFKNGRFSTHDAGTKPRFDNPSARDQPHESMPLVQVRFGQRTNIGDAFSGGEPRKRRHFLSQETGMPRKRAKTDILREKPLLATPPPQSKQPTEQEQSMLVPSAPRKKCHKLTKVAPELSSPVQYTQSRKNQHTKEAPEVALTGIWGGTEQRTSNVRRKTSHDTSQSPRTFYYQQRRSKRGHEESQDSMTHSQDVRRF